MDEISIKLRYFSFQVILFNLNNFNKVRLMLSNESLQRNIFGEILKNTVVMIIKPVDYFENIVWFHAKSILLTL